jgi:pantothenate kinase-related protein Tda10
MSIFEETGQTTSITEHWKALDLFVDRYELLRLFASYVNDKQPKRQILYIFGIGGTGKSLLLSYIRRHYCKHLPQENWKYIKRLSDDEKFRLNLEQAQAFNPVPFALLDFSQSGTHDPLLALAKLRRDLSGNGLIFPLYDYASVLYQKKSKASYPRENRGNFSRCRDGFVSCA